jgi:hypothetical protein
MLATARSIFSLTRFIVPLIRGLCETSFQLLGGSKQASKQISKEGVYF